MSPEQAPTETITDRRRLEALVVLNYIRATQAVHKAEWMRYATVGGRVVGPRQTVPGIPFQVVCMDVNVALDNIGGIDYTVTGEDGDSRQVTLTEWYGPDENSPQTHLWLGQDSQRTLPRQPRPIPVDMDLLRSSLESPAGAPGTYDQL